MSENTKLVILSAGGTGGHVMPAQALALDLISRGYRVDLRLGLPALCALTARDPVDGSEVDLRAIRQPVAFQRNTADLSWYHTDLTFCAEIVSDGTPYSTNNPDDSPGEGSDRITRATADAFSFHGLDGFSIRAPYGAGSGEVTLTVSKGCRNGHIFGAVSNNSDTAGIAIGSENLLAADRLSNISVVGCLITNPTRDIEHDHLELTGLGCRSVDGLALIGNVVRSDAAIHDDWAEATSYAIGDRVTLRDDVQIVSWTVAADADFVPGFKFRNAGIAYTGGQQIYEVPAGYTGTKGGTWDAAEEGRYTHHGTLAEATKRAESVTFEAVAASTGEHPAFDFAGGFWSSANIAEPMKYGILVDDCTDVSERANVVSGYLYGPMSLGTTPSTWRHIDAVSAFETAGLPALVPGADNGGKGVFDTTAAAFVYAENGAWVSRAAASSAVVWSGDFDGAGSLTNGHNIAADASRASTGRYSVMLSTPMPAHALITVQPTATDAARATRWRRVDSSTIEVDVTTTTNLTAYQNSSFRLQVVA